VAIGLDMLAQVLAGLCEEIRQLRDDLYNHAVIVKGDAFATAVPLSGSRQFTTSEMPGQSGVVAHRAVQNTQTAPIAVFVRIEPAVTSTAPLTLEDAVLLLAISADEAKELDRAALTPVGRGLNAGATVVLRQGETLFVSALASQAVTVSWRIIQLRGRRILFSE